MKLDRRIMHASICMCMHIGRLATGVYHQKHSGVDEYQIFEAFSTGYLQLQHFFFRSTSNVSHFKRKIDDKLKLIILNIRYFKSDFG